MTYETAKSWPFQEARSLIQHITRKGKKPGDVVTFETGYGPSGAPHIGTFGEVVRTLWVMRAFDELTDRAYKTRLIMFSDDYDAMRKVPDGMPEWMNEHLGKPLSSVPNPYPSMDNCVANDAEQYPVSFAAVNNGRLTEFVNNILDYRGERAVLPLGFPGADTGVFFASSTAYYTSGCFNEMLDRVWDNYDAIQAVMLPTLGEDRRATYSPFMPFSFKGDRLLQVKATPSPVLPYWIEYEDVVPDGPRGVSGNIHDGHAKLQWKVDWAMRWVHFDVDYEMSGKDLIESVKASSQICRILGGTPPLNMTYELFLDEEGQKISKSKGNGFTVEEWLDYGSVGSLCLFMFQNPRAAKKLYMGLIPTTEDELIKGRRKVDLTPDDPWWHIKGPKEVAPLQTEVNFQLLLNLAKVTQAKDSKALLAYLEQDRPIILEEYSFVSRLAERVLRYATDKGLLARNLREPTEQERAAFHELADRLALLMPAQGAEAFQYQVYEVGKEFGFNPLRSWFQSLYECFFGASEGPRFGAFAEAYGLQNTIEMLRKA